MLLALRVLGSPSSAPRNRRSVALAAASGGVSRERRCAAQPAGQAPSPARAGRLLPVGTRSDLATVNLRQSLVESYKVCYSVLHGDSPSSQCRTAAVHDQWVCPWRSPVEAHRDERRGAERLRRLVGQHRRQESEHRPGLQIMGCQGDGGAWRSRAARPVRCEGPRPLQREQATYMTTERVCRDCGKPIAADDAPTVLDDPGLCDRCSAEPLSRRTRPPTGVDALGGSRLPLVLREPPSPSSA